MQHIYIICAYLENLGWIWASWTYILDMQHCILDLFIMASQHLCTGRRCIKLVAPSPSVRSSKRLMIDVAASD